MTPLMLCTASLFFVDTAHAEGEIRVGVPEPSGIDIDRAGERVFVVDDGGELWVFDTDFERQAVFDLGGDLEGVAYLPRQDQLLVAVEGDEQLLRVDPSTGAIEQVYDVPRTFRGQTVLAAGGNGIETLTAVGSRLFVANQAFDDRDAEDASVLVELAFGVSGSLRIVDVHALPMMDVAGSFYSARSGELTLVSDAEDALYSIRLDALDAVPTGADLRLQAFTSTWVPGEDQEGICVIDGQLVIAQDSGNLYDAGPLDALWDTWASPWGPLP